MFNNHWKKITLALTTLFWASCSSDNPTVVQPAYGVVCPPEGCGNPELSSSAGAVPTSSTEATSSEAASSSSLAESSSSEVNPSSSSVNPNLYRLASDPSVTCTQSNINGGKCLDEEDAKNNEKAIQRKIDEYKKTVEENQTLTLEQLDSLEEKTIADLKKWIDADNKAYRTPQLHCTHVDLGTPIYKCSNNETYDATTLVTDYTEKLIYTKEAHKAKFPEKYQSSSSTEPSSSNSATPPSPLCQKHDFTAEQGLYDAYKKETKELVDIALKANEGSLREKDSLCLERIQESGFMPSETSEVIATKQTCDGETIVNPRYQKELDSNKSFIQNLIDKCIQYSKIDQTACDFDAMCPEYGVDSKCTYKYTCNDGVTCHRTAGETNMDCTNKQGEKVTYSKNEFDKKYYTKNGY
jgi:hypothetical protein